VQPDPNQEADLVTAAQGGDVAAFEALVRTNTPRVYAHAMRFFGDVQLAEDATQEVFVKVYRSLPEFDGRSKFSTWLYRVTRNTCLDMFRSGRRQPMPIDPIDVTSSIPDLADATALSVALEAALRTLPPEDRDALSSVALFGLSYAEAAQALGVPAGTVKSRVFRARRALTATLELRPGGGA
jgi:RNA polymerase sigma-70 factor (ECF subfamily)